MENCPIRSGMIIEIKRNFFPPPNRTNLAGKFTESVIKKNIKTQRKKNYCDFLQI